MLATHTQETLKDLRTLIARLQSAAEVLELLDNPTHTIARIDPKTEPPLCPPPPAPAELLKRIPPDAKLKKKFLTKGKIDPRVLGNPVLGAIAGAAEPFTVTALAEDTGLKWKSVDNFARRMADRGWLKREPGSSPTAFRRTAHFPKLENNGDGESPPPVAVPASSSATPRVQLQRDYDTTIKARDSALAAGNDKLVEIHQKRIDQLAGQLGL